MDSIAHKWFVNPSKNKSCSSFQIFLSNFLDILLILDKNIKKNANEDFEAGYGSMDTKNEVREANYLFFKNFIKKGKKGKRGTIYLDSKKKIDFDQFYRSTI